jgi:hypothetical protein
MRTIIIAAIAFTALATAAHAQSSLPDGRDGRQLGMDLYQYRGDRESIMRELGRGGRMSWGMGGGVVPAYRYDQPQFGSSSDWQPGASPPLTGTIRRNLEALTIGRPRASYPRPGNISLRGHAATGILTAGSGRRRALLGWRK